MMARSNRIVRIRPAEGLAGGAFVRSIRRSSSVCLSGFIAFGSVEQIASGVPGQARDKEIEVNCVAQTCSLSSISENRCTSRRFFRSAMLPKDRAENAEGAEGKKEF